MLGELVERKLAGYALRIVAELVAAGGVEERGNEAHEIRLRAEFRLLQERLDLAPHSGFRAAGRRGDRGDCLAPRQAAQNLAFACRDGVGFREQIADLVGPFVLARHHDHMTAARLDVDGTQMGEHRVAGARLPEPDNGILAHPGRHQFRELCIDGLTALGVDRKVGEPMSGHDIEDGRGGVVRRNDQSTLVENESRRAEPRQQLADARGMGGDDPVERLDDRVVAGEIRREFAREGAGQVARLRRDLALPTLDEAEHAVRVDRDSVDVIEKCCRIAAIEVVPVLIHAGATSVNLWSRIDLPDRSGNVAYCLP